MNLSPDLEQDILVALFRDHNLLVWASARLEPEDLTNEVYAEVWYMMKKLWSRHKEPVTFNALKHEVESAIEAGEFLPEDIPVLSELFVSLREGEIMQDWTRERLQLWLDEKAYQRYTADVNRAMAEGRTGEIHEAYRNLQSRVSKADDGPGDILDEEVWLSLIRRQAEQEGRVISTGLSAFDDLFGGGLFKGEFGMVFGVEGLGKSFFGIQLGFSAWVERRRVLHISNEMQVPDIQTRYVTKLTSTPKDRFSSREETLIEQRRLHEHLKGLLEVRYVEPMAPPDSVAAMLEEARVEERPFEVVIVDYIDQFRLEGRGQVAKWEMLMELFSYFSGLAKEYDCCIVALSHADSKAYDRKFVGAGNVGLSKVGKNKSIDFGVSMGQDREGQKKGLVYFQVTKLRNRATDRPRLVCRQSYDTASFIPLRFEEVED